MVAFGSFFPKMYFDCDLIKDSYGYFLGISLKLSYCAAK